VLWKKLYESCVSETNPDKLKRLVFQLEEAIVVRYHDLASEPNAFDELQAIRRAAQQLLQLKIERLAWPQPVTAEAAAMPAAMPVFIQDSVLARAPTRVDVVKLVPHPTARRTVTSRIQSALVATQRAWQNWVFKSLK
jgi:hypothetical protein